MTDLLEITDLSRNFGGLKALDGISFESRSGEILGIIGPNGAGKTTLFNVVSGIYPPSSGQINFAGRSIGGQKPDEIARLGIGRTFQATTVFKGRTVRENLERSRGFCKLFSPLAALGLRRNPSARDTMTADAVLDFIGMTDHAEAEASSLAYGLQKTLGVGMALIQSPKIMMMDEPAAGLNSSEKQEMAQLVKRIRDDFKVAIMLIEHDMKMVMGICDRIQVISYGRHVAIGTPAEIQRNPDVIDAYLGVDDDLA